MGKPHYKMVRAENLKRGDRFKRPGMKRMYVCMDASPNNMPGLTHISTVYSDFNIYSETYLFVRVSK